MAKMKPVEIAVWDGIVMGGGVGISVHAPIKIATEGSMFAMPEAKIGFFTDVGAGYFLSRLRNNLGMWLGLTGSRLRGRELVQTGIAHYYVPKKLLPELEQAIVQKVAGNSKIEDIRQIIALFAEKVEPKYENEETIA